MTQPFTFYCRPGTGPRHPPIGQLARKEMRVLFPAWETFYVIVGSSAGALTGLMFVVIALVADVGEGGEQAINAFSTPTVVHFSIALLLSVMQTAPWPSVLSARFAFAVIAAGSFVYAGIVTRRARRQTDYKPVFEDWLFHSALPLVAYLVLFVAAVMPPFGGSAHLFAVAGSILALLFIGIHNAWDTVTYIVLMKMQRRKAQDAKAASEDRS